MQRLGFCAVLLAFAVALGGCSQETQQKAGKALDQTGEALESAAKDTATVTKGALKGAKDAVEKKQAESDAEPSK